MGEVGEERGVTRYVKTAGGHIGHVIVFAGTGSDGERARLCFPLECGEATKEASGGGGLRVVSHALGPCHSGRVVGPNAGPNVAQVHLLVQDHVVEEDGGHF
jgi:hypothetical protein